MRWMPFGGSLIATVSIAALGAAQAAPAPAAAPAPSAEPAPAASPTAAPPATASAEAAPAPADTPPNAAAEGTAMPASGAHADAMSDSSSEGEQRRPIGIDVGLRFGWSVPSGEFVEETKINEVFDGYMPFAVDVGYRITDRIVVGGYFAYGVGFFSGKSDFTCDDQNDPTLDVGDFDEVDCKAQVLRYGLQARYHFRPDKLVDPWAGAGIGFERVSIKSDDLGTSFSLSGLEMVNLNLGLDIQLAGQARLGPYVQLAVAKYSTFDFTCGDDACEVDDQEIDSKGSHFWSQGGVRLSYVF